MADPAAGRALPRVAVVVPAHDGRRWLPACLAALAAQTEPPLAVVVVDDASRDGTSAWLAREHPEVELVVRPEQGGFARAVNAGLERAAALGADAVALVNTDVELAPDWLALTRRALGAPGVASVATKMVALEDPGLIDDAGDELRRDGAATQRGRGKRDLGRWDAEGRVWGACAGAALYRLDVVRELGGLDERLGQYLEDVDLGLRLRLAGWDCAYVPAVARHANGGSAAGLRAPVRYWVARNTLLLVATWFPVGWWWRVAHRQAALVAEAARQGPEALRWQLLGLAAGVRGARRRLRGRRRRLRGGVRTVAEAVPDVPWRGPAATNHPLAPD